MRKTRLMFGGTAFILSDDIPVEHVKAMIVEALRSGGGFVQLSLHGGRSISILVGPASTAMIESIDIPDVRSDAIGMVGLDAAFMDWDI